MQLRALKIPNSLSSLTAVAWMNYYFKLVAENVPNAAEELHLEPIKKKDIYEEYQFDVKCYHELVEPIRLELFLDIWASVFDYVKIRKFKQCCGKCNLCAHLSELRRKFTDVRGREEVTRLFEVYRITYWASAKGIIHADCWPCRSPGAICLLLLMECNRIGACCHGTATENLLQFI